jgi:hypothetical protein
MWIASTAKPIWRAILQMQFVQQLFGPREMFDDHLGGGESKGCAERGRFRISMYIRVARQVLLNRIRFPLGDVHGFASLIESASPSGNRSLNNRHPQPRSSQSVENPISLRSSFR